MLRGATQPVTRRVCVSVCGNFFPTNPYLQAGLTDLDEIWHDGRSYGVASPKFFWWTLAHFFWEHKFSITDISGIFQPIATKFCMVVGFVE